MAKDNKKTNFFEITLLIFMGLGFFVLTGLPEVTSHVFKVDNYVDNYIDNSKTVKINQFQFVGVERVSIGAAKYKRIYRIKSNNRYYGLEYYKDGTRDYFFPGFSEGKRYERRIFIRLNPIELGKHKGTIEDPIPVYNYGLAPNEFVWDAQKYKYNIKTHQVFEEILHANSYEVILIFILIICCIPIGYIRLKPSPEEVKQAEIKKAEKKRKKLAKKNSRTK